LLEPFANSKGILLILCRPDIMKEHLVT
jgi:hypothetical protein